MAKDGSDSLDDDISEKIIMKLVKQRKESASIFIQNRKKDLAKDEISQMKYLEVYLPEQMSEDEIRKVVKEVVEKLGVTSPERYGKMYEDTY